MRSISASSAAAQSEAVDRISILLPLPLGGAYDYALPEGMRLAPGDFVKVPLGGRLVTGVVWDKPLGESGAVPVPDERLREIEECLPAPPMPETLRRFIEWVASYTVTPWGAVLRMAITAPAALLPPKPIIAYRSADLPLEAYGLKITPARARVVRLLADGLPRPLPEILRETAVGAAVVRAMIAAGALEATEMSPPPPFAIPDHAAAGPSLSPAQATAAKELRKAVGANFSATLIDGVGGA